jgi:predicted metal-dependent HD superfamily phosphohydrolase
MNAPNLVLLRDHFQRSFLAASLNPPAGVFESLCARYSEPSRAYHTLQHIAEGIEQIKAARNPPPEVALAWWFHDGVYDPKRQDNEDKSAAWAKAVLGATPLSAKVEAAILATKLGAPAADPGQRLLVDVDLAILAAPEPRFSEYQAQIRREYAFVADADYARERLGVLRGFTARAYIYQSPELRGLETRARKNLERAINALIVAKR